VDRERQATFVERSFDQGRSRDSEISFDWS
jgi:hypothetical protein